jgi:hypothetical protein
MEEKQTATSFGYSATRIDELGASEYTLVTLIVDQSGSVSRFRKEIESCIKEVIGACSPALCPYSDKLMIRLVLFDNQLEEVHGYKLLENCNPDDYNGCIRPGGTTALHDATKTSVDATVDYAKALVDQDYGVNAIVAIITDGLDNDSSFSARDCRNSLEEAVTGEMLESIRSILVGVDTDKNPHVVAGLKEFKDVAGIDQFESIGNANAKSLAKVAEFFSQSISAQSQALGTGGPSKPISLSI